MPAGYVYVLTHPVWPGMVKIGMTTRDPARRAAEIRSVSGLLAPCTVAWCVSVSDCAAVELGVKRALGHKRVSKGRELFRVAPAEARAAIEAVAAGHIRGSVVVPIPRRTQPRYRRRTFRPRLTRRQIETVGAVLALLAVLYLAT